MNPRVVVLTPFFRPIMGGVESNAERLSRYFASAGFQVTVLTKRLTPDLPDAESTDGFSIIRIGRHGPRSPAAKWMMLRPVYSWLVTHRDEYDVVCSIDCRGVGLAALAARSRTGHAVIAQPQTTGVLVPERGTGIFRQAAGRLVGQLYARSNAIACIARTIEREALTAGVARERVHYLPNAIDMTRFQPPTPDERSSLRRQRGILEGTVVCVFLGRLSREKGLMDLMHAWQHLRPTHALLLVAGPDMTDHAWNVGPAARAFAQQHQIEASVRFVGPVEDVPALLRVADIVVQPSHFEALGLSAVEALACGAPVIATRVGGLLDFIRNDENGLTCPPRDPDALARALEELLADPARRYSAGITRACIRGVGLRRTCGLRSLCGSGEVIERRSRVRRDRRLLTILCVLLSLSYAYFYQAGGWNQNSRFALVRAILERQTLQIDAYQLHTGDRALWNGHYYSDKAPGVSLAALLPSAAARVTARAVGVDPEGFPGLAWTSYVATVCTAGLFTALAALAIFVVTRRWGYSTGASLFAALAFGIGGPAACYGTLFMAHGMTAGCLTAALALVLLLDDADARRRRDVAVALGLATGWSVVTEFQSAIPAALIVALALTRAAKAPREDFAAFTWRLLVAGGACAVVLLTYNALAFGNPLHLGYQSEERFEELRRGFFGITTPELWRVRELLFGAYRGLLPLWPLAALAPVGLLSAARDPRRRATALTALFIAVYYVILNASYHYWEGGWAYGPRQIMSAMPFVALGLAPLWDARRLWFRGVLAAAFAWGTALALVAEATNPQPDAAIKSPVTELMWPAFRDGDLSLNSQTVVHSVPPGGQRPGRDVPRAAWNLGEIAGLHGRSSLVPLGVIWIVGAGLLWTTRRP